MKERYGMIVLGAALIIAAILMLACSSGPKVYKAPCCGEEVCDTYESEVIESIEEPDLTRDYEEPQTGSFDFLLEEDDKITSSLIATKCLTCGIHFTHPAYGEHIKTCCPQ